MAFSRLNSRSCHHLLSIDQELWDSPLPENLLTRFSAGRKIHPASAFGSPAAYRSASSLESIHANDYPGVAGPCYWCWRLHPVAHRPPTRPTQRFVKRPGLASSQAAFRADGPVKGSTKPARCPAAGSRGGPASPWLAYHSGIFRSGHPWSRTAALALARRWARDKSKRADRASPGVGKKLLAEDRLYPAFGRSGRMEEQRILQRLPRSPARTTLSKTERGKRGPRTRIRQRPLFSSNPAWSKEGEKNKVAFRSLLG